MASNESGDAVAFTHLDQPLADVTKRELVDYVDGMSERLVRVLTDRPLSVIRVRPGSEPFMQKNLPKYASEWIRSVATWAERSKRTVTYPVCDDRRTLLWLANQRAVEFHPTLFRVADDGRPTHLVLDIDPPDDSDFRIVVRAAELVHAALLDAGLDAAVKTSGAKGVHIFVPVASADSEQAAAASRAIAARVERLDPRLTTTAFVREERHGKVFLDSTRARRRDGRRRLQSPDASGTIGVLPGWLGRSGRGQPDAADDPHRAWPARRRRPVDETHACPPRRSRRCCSTRAGRSRWRGSRRCTQANDANVNRISGTNRPTDWLVDEHRSAACLPPRVATPACGTRPSRDARQTVRCPCTG